MKHAYIFGPMRGIESFNFPAFDAAAVNLRALGWGVFSPAERDREDGFNPDSDEAKPLWHYMRIDLPEVCKADCLIGLPGWQQSTGCNIEVFVALACGIPVLEYETMQPIKPYPPSEAFWTVKDVMGEGLQKHKADSWRDESYQNHVLKAARHALTYTLIAEGFSPPDGEDHTRMLLCRSAFALTQKKTAAMEVDLVCGV